MRGATLFQCFRWSLLHISIHASHAGSDEEIGNSDGHVEISIHASHAGSDDHPSGPFTYRLTFQSTLPMRGATGISHPVHACHRFQSTLPMRGATEGNGPSDCGCVISIHASHAGSDRNQQSNRA